MKLYLLTDEAKEDLADIRAYLKREAGIARCAIYPEENQGGH